MNLLVKILIGLIALIVVVLIVAIFSKKEYTVERQITINKPARQIFDYVKYIKNQDNYSKWNMLDPGMTKEYMGTDGTPGFVYMWDSTNKDAGKGEQQITGITDGQKIEMGLHFIKPFEGKAEAWMKTDSIAVGQTKVSWGLHSKMPYPMNIMLLFMNMDKMLGDDLNTGLTNLKVLMEK